MPERTYMVTEEWGKEENFRFQPKPHPCDRTCKTGDSKRCHFVFIVERFTSLGKVSLYSSLNKEGTYIFKIQNISRTWLNLTFSLCSHVMNVQEVIPLIATDLTVYKPMDMNAELRQ